MTRLAVASALSLALGASGCALDPSDLAGFLDSPFGNASGSAMTLDEPGVERVMDIVVGRFRDYNRLREALPFSAIGGDDVCAVVTESGDSVDVDTDLQCVLGPPASGHVTLEQTQLASSPVAVFRFAIGYVQAFTSTVIVEGTETITETVDDDGATVHVLDLVQNGIIYKYTFRSGELGGAPVFDYTVDASGGELVVRLTNPTTAGVFASVLITGFDGTLTCELRDTDWDLPPRGQCNNGVTFGLP